MILERLTIDHLRNHRHSGIDCPSDLALLCGDNGAGKTTVLESISLLCTTRSFVTQQDRTLVRNGADGYRVDGAFLTAGGVRHTVTVLYPGAAGRKQVLFDNAPISAADLIGRFPLVTLAPQHRAVTSGGPAERRAFLDLVVSQASHAYLLDLFEYRRVLRHRNALLLRTDVAPALLREELEAWNRALASPAVRIVRRRIAFLRDYEPYFRAAMRAIVDAQESPDFAYRHAAGIEPDGPDAEERFFDVLQHTLQDDLRRRSTSVGPHRDDLELRINGLDVRAHASQGQHKTLLIALKVGEWHYLNDRVDEPPMLLLDDIFSELDDRRLSRILDLLPGLGQTFITTANRSLLERFPGAGGCAVFRIERGDVRAYAEAA